MMSRETFGACKAGGVSLIGFGFGTLATRELVPPLWACFSILMAGLACWSLAVLVRPRDAPA